MYVKGKWTSCSRPEKKARARCAGKAALLEGMAVLGESGRFSDVELVADGGAVRLPAHRAVLAMRSRVFDRLFSQDTMLEVRLSRCLDFTRPV